MPADRAPELQAAEIRLAALQRARRDLEVGRGRYADTAEGETARDFNTARSRRQEAERFAQTADSWGTRRGWGHRAHEWAGREVKAQSAYDEVVVPEAVRLDRQIDDVDDRVNELRQHQEDRNTWHREHPNAAAQLEAIEGELNPLSEMAETHQQLSRLLSPRYEVELRAGVEHGPDLGIDIGL